VCLTPKNLGAKLICKYKNCKTDEKVVRSNANLSNHEVADVICKPLLGSLGRASPEAKKSSGTEPQGSYSELGKYPTILNR
jgi:hypothetical protein